MFVGNFSRACPRRQPAVLPLTSGSVADCPQLSERVASTTSEKRLRSDGLVPLKPGMLVSASIMLCCSSQNKTSLPKADDSLELAHFISTRRRHHPSGHLLLMLIPDGSTRWSRLPSSAVSLRSHKTPPGCARRDRSNPSEMPVHLSKARLRDRRADRFQ